MEPQFHATVDGNLLSKINLLRFIRAFNYSHEMPNGYFMEFGVLNGQGLVQAYSQLRGKLTHLYGFDTFAGLPELSADDEAANALMPQFRAGNFASMAPSAVRNFIVGATSGLNDDNMTLVQGAFSETLPAFDRAQLAGKGPCLAVNVDCDLYSSSQDVFSFLDGIVTTGTWLLLDDYWTYRGSPYHGQRRAFDEWMASSARIGTTFYSNYNGFCRSYICYEKEPESR
jgi:hypothetical protein